MQGTESIVLSLVLFTNRKLSIETFMEEIKLVVHRSIVCIHAIWELNNMMYQDEEFGFEFVTGDRRNQKGQKLTHQKTGTFL